MTDFKPSIVNIAEICVRHDIRNVVLSPGSRSAPLALAFLRHPQIRTKTIVDERSAAFIALGMAQQTEHPVALVCTSGTAALNYAPAVAEAFYQQIPLVVFTADRPPEWLGQCDGQTIFQRYLYGQNCRGYFELPVDDSHPDAKWHIQRTISDAINKSMSPVPGPVQVNVPLREPLYPEHGFSYTEDSKIISIITPDFHLSSNDWRDLIAAWQQAKKKLIIAGLHKPAPSLVSSLQFLRENCGVPVIADVASNCHASTEIHHADMILWSGSEEMLRQLAPELLISFGGPVVSKSLKLFLRKYPPKEHWRLQLEPVSADPFKSLTKILPVTADYFFTTLQKKLPGDASKSQNDYVSVWQKKETVAKDVLNKFLVETPFSELAAMQAILAILPPDCNLQLGNSSVVRWANFLSLAGKDSISVNSNRGTNGIDGTVSTAAGAAMVSGRLTTLITGDLAFFYDRNALWNKHLTPNLKIIVFNNGGGGIFRILDGPSSLPELAEHFEVEHKRTAENTAKDHHLEYCSCNNLLDLQRCLPEFFKENNQPSLLEIHFDKYVNAGSFMKFKSMMREIR